MTSFLTVRLTKGKGEEGGDREIAVLLITRIHFFVTEI
jgi:hypothetical protein